MHVSSLGSTRSREFWSSCRLLFPDVIWLTLVPVGRSLGISGKCFPRRENCEATPGERLIKCEHHLVITILT
jgi:hypothetical protein